MSSLNEDREYYEAMARHRVGRDEPEYIYECQNCGKWNVSKACVDDDSEEKGCGETVHLRQVRRWV